MTDKVAKDTKVKFNNRNQGHNKNNNTTTNNNGVANNNNERMDVNQHTNQKGNYTRCNTKISIEENLKNLCTGFNELNNKGNNHKLGTETIKGKRLNGNRIRKDKYGLEA